MDPGRYPATVLEHSVRISQGGTWFVTLLYEVSGEQLHGAIYLTPKAARFARAQLKALGFDPDIHTVDELQDNPMLLAGRKVTVIVDLNEWQGRCVPRVARVEIEGRSLDRTTGSQLTALLRGAKKAEKADAKEPLEEDIPF